MGLKEWLAAPAEGIGLASTPQSNMLRGALARITTPLLPDDYLHLANPLWSARELRGQVIAVQKETVDSATLVIKPGWGFSSEYLPGQYIGIGLHIGGRWHWRSYSLTSVPQINDKSISITVKAMPEGFLSSHLVNGVAPGTIVRLAAPKGNFALPEPAPEKILFLTAGSGVTPVMSMMRALDRHVATAGAAMSDIAHIHSAPAETDIIFYSELQELQRTHDNVHIHFQMTDQMGIFDLARLDEVFPDWKERQTWACGPPAMLDSIEKIWQHNGLQDSLHLERFTIARTDHGGEGGTVTFAKAGRSAQLDGATTILEAGEKLGVQMPFGCRMGICQTCVAELSSGNARDLRSGREHHEGERIQTCISAASGDCTIEL